MVKRFPHLWLLSLVLLAAGFVGLGWRGEVAVMPMADMPPAVSEAPLAFVESRARIAPADEAQFTAATDQPTAQAMSLSADANGLVAAMCDLQLLAAGTDLDLDSEQWSALAAAVVRAQAVRHTYEAKIARLRQIAPGHYRAEIPVYAAAGDVLREQFNEELRTELGEPAAAAVRAKLGTRLEGRFAGFGLSVQTLEITGDVAGDLREVQIARTASYGHSDENGERVTTRREIQFPVLDDPTGDSWHALLARVGAARGES